MTDVVWAERCDHIYHCQVARDGDRGRLTITLIGMVDHVLHREAVPCDRADIDKWQKRCETVISNPDLRSIEYHR